LAEKTYDLIYLDGCPQASHVQEDAHLCWDLVNAEGIVIFNNYKWQDPSNFEEKTRVGIDDFLKGVEGEFEILHQGNHLIIKKSN
jgi:predicted O-methyltransferase YrrM